MTETNVLSNQNDAAARIAAKQKSVSIAEFLELNRQMLGFSNLSRNLFITVKEAVDNALDAGDDAEQLIDIDIKIIRIKPKEYVIIITDNGPGIVCDKVPYVFGKLLYGSKFGVQQQRRGSQGIGISAAVLSSQIDTGKKTEVITKVRGENAYCQYIGIDIKTNTPVFTNPQVVEFDKPSGVSIKINLKAVYIKEGKRSIKEYLRLISIINPHCNITLTEPDNNVIIYERTQFEVCKKTVESKIHPNTIEQGVFKRHLQESSKTITDFLNEEIYSNNPVITENILNSVQLPGYIYTRSLLDIEIKDLYNCLQNYNFKVPAESLATVGLDNLKASFNKLSYSFLVHHISAPKVFKNTIAQFEIILAYGIKDMKKDDKIDFIRTVNKTPLLLQQGGCLLTHAVQEINWKNYGFSQNKGELPSGPAILMIHLAGVKVPFTSEAKECIAEITDLKRYLKENLKKIGLKFHKRFKKEELLSKKAEKVKILQQLVPQLYDSICKITGVAYIPGINVQIAQMLQSPVLQKQEDKILITNYSESKLKIFAEGAEYTIPKNSQLEVLAQEVVCFDTRIYALDAKINYEFFETKDYQTQISMIYRSLISYEELQILFRLQSQANSQFFLYVNHISS